jgi:hypothetical protein
MNESSEPVGKYSLQDFQAFKEILAISSSCCNKTSSLATALMALLPAGIRTVLEKWNENGVTDFPWVSELILPKLPIIIYVFFSVLGTIFSLCSSTALFAAFPSQSAVVIVNGSNNIK